MIAQQTAMGMESASPDTVIASRDSLGLTVQEVQFFICVNVEQEHAGHL